MVHGGGDAHGTGPLGYQLLLFEYRQDGTGNLTLRYRHHIVHVLTAHAEGQITGGLDLNAVSNGIHTGEGDDLALFQGLRHTGRTRRLHADDAAGGLQVLHGVGKTCDKPTTADRHEDHVHIGQLLQNFKADGALSGHDMIIVKGWMNVSPCSSRRRTASA